VQLSALCGWRLIAAVNLSDPPVSAHDEQFRRSPLLSHTLWFDAAGALILRACMRVCLEVEAGQAAMRCCRRSRKAPIRVKPDVPMVALKIGPEAPKCCPPGCRCALAVPPVRLAVELKSCAPSGRHHRSVTMLLAFAGSKLVGAVCGVPRLLLSPPEVRCRQSSRISAARTTFFQTKETRHDATRCCGSRPSGHSF
jgi:hypothetical protein